MEKQKEKQKELIKKPIYDPFREIGVVIGKGKHIAMCLNIKDEYEFYHDKTKEYLGTISFYIPWKCYVWEKQDKQIIMSLDCLKEAFQMVESHVLTKYNQNIKDSLSNKNKNLS